MALAFPIEAGCRPWYWVGTGSTMAARRTKRKYDGGDSDRALAVGEDEAGSVMGTAGGGSWTFESR